MGRTLWENAAADLRGPDAAATVDPIVWDHSTRVARLTEAIIAMPEVANHVLDRTALKAAALYHDAGWLLELWSGEISAEQLLGRPTSDEQRDRAADWMTRRLANVLELNRLRLAARTIRECNNRSTTLLEARILADAENLDQIGPQAIWFMVRRQQAQRRTFADMLQTWQRQQQYGYWPARIKECLTFPSSRQLAQDRYQMMSRFMDDLAATLGNEPVAVPETPAEQADPNLLIASRVHN